MFKNTKFLKNNFTVSELKILSFVTSKTEILFYIRSNLDKTCEIYGVEVEANLWPFILKIIRNYIKEIDF